MRVSCPACQATYDVPESRIGAGRRLRCARCQHAWRVEPVAQEPVTVEAEAAAQPRVAPPPLSETELPPPLPEVREPPRAAPPPLPVLAVEPERPVRSAPELRDQSGLLMVGWMVSVVVVLAFLAALFLYRLEIMEAWAPSERFYALFGMGASSR